MHTTQIADRLVGTPLFHGVARREMDAILAAFDEQSFNAGHRVTVEGFRGAEFYIIVDGAAEVSVGGARIGGLGSGDFFGELGVLGSGRRSATVTALAPLRCAVLNNNALERLLIAHPAVGFNVLREVARRLRSTIERPPAVLRLITS